jgi:hypothetical protein
MDLDARKAPRQQPRGNEADDRVAYVLECHRFLIGCASRGLTALIGLLIEMGERNFLWKCPCYGATPEVSDGSPVGAEQPAENTRLAKLLLAHKLSHTE